MVDCSESLVLLHVRLGPFRVLRETLCTFKWVSAVGALCKCVCVKRKVSLKLSACLRAEIEKVRQTKYYVAVALSFAGGGL